MSLGHKTKSKKRKRTTDTPSIISYNATTNQSLKKARTSSHTKSKSSYYSRVTKRLREFYHQYYLLPNKTTMRPIPQSDSCCTLIDVHENDHQLKHVDTTSTSTSSSTGKSFHHVRQDLYLLQDYEDSTTIKSQLQLTNGKYLSLPKHSPSWVTDEYLSSLPSLVESSRALLTSPVTQYHSKNNDNFLYVYQREVAHVTSESDIPIIVSDLATTCHILALHSTSNQSSKLTSLTHLDGTNYNDDIHSILQTHIHHHNSQEPIELSIHIMGGYQDDTSRETTSWLLHLLASLSHQYKTKIAMTLRTCAVSSMNHDFLQNGPIGRGLAINVQTGQVHLAKVPHLFQQVPYMSLRSCRLWSEDTANTQHLTPIMTPSSSQLSIQPFHYEAFPDINVLEQLPDDIFLEYTSTSPQCEEDDFCINARSTMKYMRTTDPTQHFGPKLNQPLILTHNKYTQTWTTKQNH